MVESRSSSLAGGGQSWLELKTNHREYFTITEKTLTRAFTWLKEPTNAFTFKTLLRHYTKQVPKLNILTDRWI